MEQKREGQDGRQHTRSIREYRGAGRARIASE